MSIRVDDFLRPFGLHSQLHQHAAHVLQSLPDDVRMDLMGEAGVVFYDYEPGPGAVMNVPVKPPGKRGASRSIVLKRTLTRRSVGFVQWLIAHELAHAHLRNGGRWPGDDPELAADSLALQWGFPRPSRW
jgi:hypothetical protein